MKTFLFCSLYYNKKIATGANKRFENFIFYFEKILSHDERIIVAVKRHNIPNKLEGLSRISYIEVPQFIFLDRLFSFIYLSMKFYSLNKMIIISDFMPIPNKSLSKHIHYQLIHDIRNFTEFRRSSFFNTADLLQKNQWKKSEKIMTVSNFTKGELVSKCGIDKSNIFVSYNGIDDMYLESKPNRERDIDITYIATFEKRKNHRYLIKALSNYSSNKKLKILFVGKDLGSLDSIVDSSKLLRNIDLSIVESIPDEEQIVSIYDRTKLFVYPSLYEGFGMPLIEAISRGCRILCSDISVFREIGGNFPTYFNPNNNPSDLMKLIEKELACEDVGVDNIEGHLDKFKWRTIAKKFYLYAKS